MHTNDTVDITRNYYDSTDADEFYYRIWGGEDIHIGVYESETDTIKQASEKTVRLMAEELHQLSENSHVLDVGAGYGGAARWLAENIGCQITCLNLSEVENRRSQEKNEALGLSKLITIISGNFEDIPMKAQSVDIVWSEDAILHSAQRQKVFSEIDRVLKKGGEFIFTDPMMADDCSLSDLEPVLKRIHLPSMGSVKIYQSYANELGWEKGSENIMPEQLTTHYLHVKEALTSRYNEMRQYCSESYLEGMLAGLQHWIEAGKAGKLNWGILHFRKK